MNKDNTPEYMKQLSGKVLEINFKSRSLKMSFLATEDICPFKWDDHSRWFHYGYDGFMYGFFSNGID